MKFRKKILQNWTCIWENTVGRPSYFKNAKRTIIVFKGTQSWNIKRRLEQEKVSGMTNDVWTMLCFNANRSKDLKKGKEELYLNREWRLSLAHSLQLPRTIPVSSGFLFVRLSGFRRRQSRVPVLLFK